MHIQRWGVVALLLLLVCVCVCVCVCVYVCAVARDIVIALGVPVEPRARVVAR